MFVSWNLGLQYSDFNINVPFTFAFCVVETTSLKKTLWPLITNCDVVISSVSVVTQGRLRKGS